MKVFLCDLENHGAVILEIFNEAILNSHGLYIDQPWSEADLTAWFRSKEVEALPVIGVENEKGQFAGFATYGYFRSKPGFRKCFEHSVYIHRDHRAQGFGRCLLEAIIDLARKNGGHTLVGAIDASNEASVQLHRSLGFDIRGNLPEVALKFGERRDLLLLHRYL